LAHQRGAHHERREDAGGVEAGAVLHDDDGLALANADVDGGGRGLLAGLAVGDDLGGDRNATAIATRGVVQ